MVCALKYLAQYTHYNCTHDKTEISSKKLSFKVLIGNFLINVWSR